ncbi:DUF4190 domain-containing protein [Demequina sp. NBRC 110056]|uniref:DUF4190 domain-containing protein n=1 Tax=Demequina sp. NBRC 110056 TaxID=1570345 RepID=UPI00135648DA|nr:DUF4190 domain-containing protein [Demequina sp. NBRC 110056]
MTTSSEDPNAAPQPPQPAAAPQPQPAAPEPAAPQYAQPGYAQPQYAQQYAPAPTGPQPGTEKNWMGITSLVLSLAGLFTGISVVGGIIFGHLGLSAAKRGEADNRGISLAGVITGYVLLGMFIVGAIIAVIFFSAVVGGLISECAGDSPAEWCTDTAAAWESAGSLTGP